MMCISHDHRGVCDVLRFQQQQALVCVCTCRAALRSPPPCPALRWWPPRCVRMRAVAGRVCVCLRYVCARIHDRSRYDDNMTADHTYIYIYICMVSSHVIIVATPIMYARADIPKTYTHPASHGTHPHTARRPPAQGRAGRRRAESGPARAYTYECLLLLEAQHITHPSMIVGYTHHRT
eukprot:GHVU01109060.1.p1 GENE.GHVU01109060.1~~GHVU01109060.1.p1  ORF type:complete len:179 (+),score=12.62 GHVU01109060.1:198-734(+)